MTTILKTEFDRLAFITDEPTRVGEIFGLLARPFAGDIQPKLIESVTRHNVTGFQQPNIESIYWYTLDSYGLWCISIIRLRLCEPQHGLCGSNPKITLGFEITFYPDGDYMPINCRYSPIECQILVRDYVPEKQLFITNYKTQES